MDFDVIQGIMLLCAYYLKAAYSRFQQTDLSSKTAEM